MTILVTGATGNVGTYVVEELRRENIPFRVGARNIEHTQEALGYDVEVVTFDYLKAETYQEAFSGIERLFLVRPPQLSNVQKEIAPAIKAAVEAGIQHVVFLSVQGVEQNRYIPHYRIEQMLVTCDLTYTFLRAGFFMQNLSTMHREEIRTTDEIALPVGQAPSSLIDTRDIAAVAVRTLVEDEHINKAYVLTGGEALDYYQVAEIMSDVLKRPIRYTDPFILKFIWRQIRLGYSLGFAFFMAMLYTITRFGNAAEVTDDVARILQREPIPFRQFVEDHRECWL